MHLFSFIRKNIREREEVKEKEKKEKTERERDDDEESICMHSAKTKKFKIFIK